MIVSRHVFPFPFIIVWAISLHIAWGIALIADTAVVPAALFVGLHWMVALSMNGPSIGVVLIIAAALAAAGLIFQSRLTRTTGLLLLMPQYALLVAAFLADAQSVVTGSVDGREIDRLLLGILLCPVMIAAVLHSAAIIERHMLWTQR